MMIKFTRLALIPFLFCAISPAQDAPGGAFANQVPVNASLKKELNSKAVKVGEPFTAAVENPVTIHNTTLPKGTLLLGHVVDVTPHTKETPNASITIVFDHAQVKKADPIPISASVYKISFSEGQLRGQRTDVDTGMRGSRPSSSTASQVRALNDQQSHTVRGSQAATGAPVQVVSMIPGVALAAVASDTKSAVFSSEKHDVEIGAGTELVVGVFIK